MIASRRLKGVTPVISVVLLMTIAVSAAATAWQFQNDITNQFEDTSTTELQQRELRKKSGINIEYMYNSSLGNFTLMSLANTGSIALDIENDDKKKLRIFVDGAPLEPDSTSWNYVNEDDPTDYNLEAQTSVLINTTESFPARGGRKTFKVTAPYENSDTKVCINEGGNSC